MLGKGRRDNQIMDAFDIYVLNDSRDGTSTFAGCCWCSCRLASRALQENLWGSSGTFLFPCLDGQRCLLEARLQEHALLPEDVSDKASEGNTSRLRMQLT